MQNKPGDTPKIIGLVIAIIAVLGFLVWRLVQATQSSAANAGVTAASTAAAANAPLQTASATVPESTSTTTGAAQAGVGQMRYFDDVLDADPPQGQLPSIPSPRANAFRRFKAPPPTPAKPIVHPVPGNNGAAPPTYPGGTPPTWNPTPGGPTAPTPPSLPAQDISLDGVVLGPDGFAMLTIREPGAGGETSVYKRIGEKIAGHVIVGMSDSGITLQGHRQLWPVGQTLHFGLPIAPQMRVAPAPASAALPTLMPVPAPTGSAPLQPPTVTR